MIFILRFSLSLEIKIKQFDCWVIKLLASLIDRFNQSDHIWQDHHRILRFIVGTRNFRLVPSIYLYTFFDNFYSIEFHDRKKKEILCFRSWSVVTSTIVKNKSSSRKNIDHPSYNTKSFSLARFSSFVSTEGSLSKLYDCTLRSRRPSRRRRSILAKICKFRTLSPGNLE